MIIGHESIINDFKRLSKTGKLNHGYIFFGPTGVGKRLTALALANYLESGIFEEPKILTENLLIRPEENGSIGIDAVRQIKNFLWQKPFRGNYRSVVINDADYLTGEAQAALLKIAEEPPSFGLLILIAKDPESFLPTISSRLPKIYFSPVRRDLIIDWLRKERGIIGREAEILALKSFGKPGLASDLAADKKTQVLLGLAEDFLKISTPKRREFIKKLVEPENFNFVEFLDALSLVLAYNLTRDNKKWGEFWHRLMELRREVSYFNPNPRLQLLNLVNKTSSCG